MALRIPRVIRPPSEKHKSEFPKTYWKSFRENLSYHTCKYKASRVRNVLSRKK